MCTEFKMKSGEVPPKTVWANNIKNASTEHKCTAEEQFASGDNTENP